ncbi:hypothetical protein V495_07575 [Pseudogymnoascus sp. VKM F-4514 (FW-929)]|nr:hypothetical protein V495_07575 [Pseudogymnoascus sp. VKM F-4514 (FW-929)]KFY52077.1 hypothetical protein V497_08661 [Pseudogymnoascus sp. VKM F-4516 (FW-969)]
MAATLEQRWKAYKQMNKKDLLAICEDLNIDVIWKAWKDDIIRTTIEVQDKLTKGDPITHIPGFEIVTQFVSGYESLEPLPTAEPRQKRADRYKLVLKNDLIARCKEFGVPLGWKSSRDELVEAILKAEVEAGEDPNEVIPIKSTARPTIHSEDQPMTKHQAYYGDKSRKYLKRRCKEYNISKSKRKTTSQLARFILEKEGRATGLLKTNHVFIPRGTQAPFPPGSRLGPRSGIAPIVTRPWQRHPIQPKPHAHVNHSDIRVIYPEPPRKLLGGTGLPLTTKQFNPVYERYRQQTEGPREVWYEPLGRTPRMQVAAAKYHSMTLDHLQSIVKARALSRGIELDYHNKLSCVDVLLEDDRKNNLLPAAPPAPIYDLHPGELAESNPDEEIFIRTPTVMQVDVLKILEESPWVEAEGFMFSREEFYEQFTQAELEPEVHARRVMYEPTIRRLLVRSDMRTFERLRRRMAGLPARAKYGIKNALGVRPPQRPRVKFATVTTASTVPTAATVPAAATVPTAATVATDATDATGVAGVAGVAGSGNAAPVNV